VTAATVLIFGEGDQENDRRALEHLIFALAPKGVRVRCKRLRSPIILDKKAERRKHKRVAREVAAHEEDARGSAGRGERVIVVAFHDCDEVEPAHEVIAEQIQADLRAAGVKFPVAAVPAWSIEAWWMLFPEALAKTRTCWSVTTVPANVGKIRDAKSQLMRNLRNKGSRRCPDYHERDSITIAKNVRDMGLAVDERTGRADSLARFRDSLRAALARGS